MRRVSGEGFAAFPSWSPDGRRVAFAGAEPGQPDVWNLWQFDLERGELSRLTAHQSGRAWGASWFPDGRRICYGLSDRLMVLDTKAGETRSYVAPRGNGVVRTPVVSPDGRRVICQLSGGGAWLFDLTDGSVRRILDDHDVDEFTWSPDGRRLAFRRNGQVALWVGDPRR
jgi:TolB protein